MRVDDLLRRNAAARGPDPAFTCGDTTHTWRETDDRCNALANAMRELGMRQGDRVAILATNCHRYFEFHFATSKAGLIGIPLNSRLIGPELEYILEDAGASAVFADAAHSDVVRKVADHLPHLAVTIGYGDGHGLDHDYETIVARASTRDPEVVLPPGALYLIGYTSGTTGRPKGAMHPHHLSTISALVYALHMGLQASDRALMTMPAYVYRGGSGGVAPIAAGAHCFVAPFSPGPILDLMESERLTYALLAPAMIGMLLREPGVEQRDLSAFRALYTGGAPIREEILERLIDLVGDVVGAVYGTTESTGIALIRHRRDGPRRLLSVGRPLPLLDVEIRADDGTSQPAGEVGEITVRGDTVMAGYWNDPARTAEVLRDGWYATGDMGYLDDEGYLYIVDRRNDIINSGGINVYSVELENVLALLPGVQEGAVIGIPDEEWGEVVAAFVVREEGAAIDAEVVVAHCREHLASYKKPRVIEFVDGLPRNEMGKVDKKVLREAYWAGQTRQVNG